MFEHAYLFFKGLTSVEYEIPIPIQITTFIIIAVILSIVIYVYKDALDASFLRDKYIWYYWIAILNIVNICAVLGYYYYKKTTLIGEPGTKGKKGPPGTSGQTNSCINDSGSLFIHPVTEYETVTSLNFTGLAGHVINPELVPALTELETVFTNNFDYGEFTNNLINGSFDINNKLTEQLVLLSVYNEFPLIKYINDNLGLADGSSEITGIIKAPVITQGYFRLADMSFGGSEEYNPTAFLVGGDVKIAGTDVDIICSFATLTDKGTNKYNIIKPIHDTDYVSLGNIITPDGEPVPDMTYAMVKRDCAKKLSSKQLKLVLVYPAASFNNANESRDNITVLDDTTQGFFSIWRTPFSTIYIKFSSGGNLLVNKNVIENLYAYNGVVPESLYTKYGTVKPPNIEKVKKYLSTIRLSKVIFATVLFGYTIEKVKFMLYEFVTQFVLVAGTDGTQIIMATPTLKKCAFPDKMLIADISIALHDIAVSIEQYNKLKLRKAEQQMAKNAKGGRIRSLLDDAGRGADGNNVYQIIKYYDNMKTTIMELSMKIENGQTLYDLFINLFPGGLESDISTDLLPSQTRIINLIAVLIPPENDIFVLNKDCLVYDNIDESRKTLELELEMAMKQLDELTKTLNTNPLAKCHTKENMDKVNVKVTETYEFINRNVGHIPNYLAKLQEARFDEFPTQKIQLIYNQIIRLKATIQQYC